MANDRLSGGESPCKALVVGASSGGFRALKTILGDLPEDLPFAIMVAIHRHPIPMITWKSLWIMIARYG